MRGKTINLGRMSDAEFDNTGLDSIKLTCPFCHSSLSFMVQVAAGLRIGGDGQLLNQLEGDVALIRTNGAQACTCCTCGNSGKLSRFDTTIPKVERTRAPRKPRTTRVRRALDAAKENPEQ